MMLFFQRYRKIMLIVMGLAILSLIAVDFVGVV